MIGSQLGANAMVAALYPARIRSTGVGWALGVGRVGSIAGPLIGGAMLELQWTPREIFLAGVLPALVSAVTVILSGRLQGKASPYRGDVQVVPSVVVH